MRQSIILTLALAALSSVAQADVGFEMDGVKVSVYGILDIGIGSLEHSYSAADTFTSTVNPYNLNSSPNSFTGIYSGGISMSRLGLKGEADLGHDIKGFFLVESAVDVNTGVLSNNGRSIFNDINGLKSANGASAIDGQVFSRAAYVGLSAAPFGSIELGRTTNFSLEQVKQYDPVQAALLYSPLGFSGGIGGGLGATENTRFDDSLKYENKVGNVEFGGQYKFAGDKDTQSAGTAYVFMLAYSEGPFSIKGTYGQTRNTVAWATQYSNVVAPDSNLQIENTKGGMVTALYKVTTAGTVKIGYEYATISAPSNTGLTYIEHYFDLTLPNPAVNASGQQHFGTFWAGGDYQFNPAFNLAIGYFDINTDNSPEVKKEYRANAYSVLADYTLSKRFDTYAGTMIMSYSGIGLLKHAPTVAYSNNAVYGVGLRFRF
jgi:GBP family porin